MSHLAGWYGARESRDDALTRMVDAMNAMSPVVERTTGGNFALATKQPGMAGQVNRIAVSDDGKVAVAFAGYLHETNLDIANNPARHCLELYEKFGLKFAGRLNGSFAAAVVDERARRVHLISDRLASRPIFYAEAAPFLFSTRMQAVLAYPGFHSDISPEQLIQFLGMDLIPGRKTLCERIMLAPPGSVLTWDGARATVTRYWSPVFTWREDATVSECGDRIAHAIRGAVGRITARAERCALMLSGGMDSRSVATASPVPLECYSMHVDEQAREVTIARRIARMLGYPHHFVRVPDDYPLQLLDMGTSISDGMISYHHSHALYLTDAVADLQPQVVLGGWALDIHFSGRTLPTLPRAKFRTITPPHLEPVSQLRTATDHWLRRQVIVPVETLGRLYGMDPDALVERYREPILKEEASLKDEMRSVYDLVQVLLLPNATYVNPLSDSPAVDHFTAVGMVAYDTEVIDAYLATPPHLRHRHIAYSRALSMLNRDAARIPNANTGVPVAAGPGLEHTMGTAIHYWRGATKRVRRALGGRSDLETAWPLVSNIMATHPRWREELRERVRSSRLVERGIVDGDALNQIVEEHLDRRGRHKNILCTWLTLEVWLGQYESALSC
ncbi:MAG: hypothetical protein J7M38_16030 [Armatimonadetes bacterium]|nr:hypothetical protein [Armatimonadota bacterium]